MTCALGIEKSKAMESGLSESRK